MELDLKEFIDIPEFENYMIDRTGRIYTKHRNRLLTLKTDKDGYYRVALSKDKSMHYFRVNRLVAITYIPNPDNKPFVNHINGVVTDNRVENLEWVTAKENTQHAIRTGLAGAYGETNHNAKLTQAQVNEIRDMYSKGYRVYEIRNYLNNIVTWEMIKNIVVGRNWKAECV